MKLFYLRKKQDKDTRQKIILNLLTCITETIDDIQVEVKSFRTRSGQQLRAYWALIGVVRLWMNEQGNKFSDENVSDYFKIKSGHYTAIDNQIISKSISNKSDCTKEQMEAIINTILQFGAENDIKGCEIADEEFGQLLRFYQK